MSGSKPESLVGTPAGPAQDAPGSPGSGFPRVRDLEVGTLDDARRAGLLPELAAIIKRRINELPRLDAKVFVEQHASETDSTNHSSYDVVVRQNSNFCDFRIRLLLLSTQDAPRTVRVSLLTEFPRNYADNYRIKDPLALFTGGAAALLITGAAFYAWFPLGYRGLTFAGIVAGLVCAGLLVWGILALLMSTTCARLFASLKLDRERLARDESDLGRFIASLRTVAEEFALADAVAEMKRTRQQEDAEARRAWDAKEKASQDEYLANLVESLERRGIPSLSNAEEKVIRHFMHRFHSRPRRDYVSLVFPHGARKSLLALRALLPLIQVDASQKGKRVLYVVADSGDLPELEIQKRQLRLCTVNFLTWKDLYRLGQSVYRKAWIIGDLDGAAKREDQWKTDAAVEVVQAVAGDSQVDVLFLHEKGRITVAQVPQHRS